METLAMCGIEIVARRMPFSRRVTRVLGDIRGGVKSRAIGGEGTFLQPESLFHREKWGYSPEK
jgi:hypothetical protein